jgi:hypothetical protein
VALLIEPPSSSSETLQPYLPQSAVTSRHSLSPAAVAVVEAAAAAAAAVATAAAVAAAEDEEPAQ